MLSTIVLSSAVLYEIAGPALAKLSLHLAGALQPACAEAPQEILLKGKSAIRKDKMLP